MALADPIAFPLMRPFPLFLAGCLLASSALGAQGKVYNGYRRELTATIPHLDDTVTVDGTLDEPAWEKAAVLTGFSAYLPIDNRPAQDSTDVYVWYSSTHVYFGVRAFETSWDVTMSDGEVAVERR